MILCSPLERNTPQTESTQCCVKNPSGAVQFCMKVGCPPSERMVTITYYLYSSLFFILVNNYFIMSFVVWPFHTQSQKETYIICLFSPSKWLIVYWSLSCAYLPKKKTLEKWPYHPPRPRCLIFIFSVICVHVYNTTRWHP